MIKSLFYNFSIQYGCKIDLVDSQWAKIDKAYCASSRKYHNMHHLEAMYGHLVEVKEFIQDWPSIMYALIFHDVVYNVLKKDNEEKSAAYARHFLEQIPNISIDAIELVNNCIVATKAHHYNANMDINFLLDADLSILGAQWPEYEKYYHRIRQEYKYYPDFLYNPGRIKVLEHFVNMDQIYKTDYFKNRMEVRAKENLKRELNIMKR